MTPEELELLIAAYALDTVDDAERAEVDAALAADPELRAEAASLAETALVLAYAAEPIEPPASLKASLMDAIASTPQNGTGDSGLEAPSAPAAHPASTVPPVQSTGRAATKARSRWFGTPGRIVAAAAAAVVLFGGGGAAAYGVFGHGTTQSQTQTAQGSTLDRIYAAADFQRSSTPVTGGGTATVVWSDSLGKSAVVFHGVGAAPSGKTYELWYIGGKIRSAGLVDDMSSGVTTAVLSGKKTAGDAVGVTVEPAGGTEQPTTTPIVAVSTRA